jgi:hypothetical protein
MGGVRVLLLTTLLIAGCAAPPPVAAPPGPDWASLVEVGQVPAADVMALKEAFAFEGVAAYTDPRDDPPRSHIYVAPADTERARAVLATYKQTVPYRKFVTPSLK